MNLTTRPINDVTSSAQQSLTPLLCYACHTTLTSRGTRGGLPAPQPPGKLATQVLPLPMWVHNHLIDDDDNYGITLKTTKLSDKEMKAEIGEFLLPDE